MQGLLKKEGRSIPVRFIGGVFGGRRFRTIALSGLASLLLTCSALLAEVPTVELSPMIAKSTLISPVNGDQEISVILALPLPDQKGLDDFIKHVSTPGDPLYHQYLTPQQFADRFGGDAVDYTALKAWAAANQLRVTFDPLTRINLTLRGTVAQFQSIFKTQLNNYRSPAGDEFYSASVKPTVPIEISSKISGVIGLTESKRLAPMVAIGKVLGENPAAAPVGETTDTAGGTGPGGSYTAKDLRTAYSIPTFGGLDKKVVVAVFEQGGFRMSDVTKYLTRNDLPSVKVTPVSVDGSSTAIASGIELEACVDIDMVIGINPKAAEVLVYEDSYKNDSFQTALLDAITLCALEDKAQILSISYGTDEGLQGSSAITAENIALAQAAALGITVFASSGDFGAYGQFFNFPYNVSDPASQPYVTGVGGTTLFTGPGEVYEQEQAWNDIATGLGATGGGISTYWSLPFYQNTTVGGTIYITQNGGSSTWRNVPDVAAVADPLTGVGVYVKDKGGWVQVGGTSVSSPIWAGYLSIMEAAYSYFGWGKIGFFNPVLYAVGTPYYGYGYPAGWMANVIEGSNGYAPYYGAPGFSNGPGYSNTTGNGSIWGGGFAAQLMLVGMQPGSPPGPIGTYAVTKTTATSVTFSWSTSSGAAGYVLGLYHPGSHGSNIETSYLTKKTTLSVTGLTPRTSYFAHLWSFDPSGAYHYPIPVSFTTPSR